MKTQGFVCNWWEPNNTEKNFKKKMKCKFAIEMFWVLAHSQILDFIERFLWNFNKNKQLAKARLITNFKLILSLNEVRKAATRGKKYVATRVYWSWTSLLLHVQIKCYTRVVSGRQNALWILACKRDWCWARNTCLSTHWSIAHQSCFRKRRLGAR